jgi:hypothetical protein
VIADAMSLVLHRCYNVSVNVADGLCQDSRLVRPNRSMANQGFVLLGQVVNWMAEQLICGFLAVLTSSSLIRTA